MARPPVRRLRALSREVYRRSRARSSARREGALRPQLRFDPGAAALVLSPHYDDAVLSCWSVLSGGQQVAVVNLLGGIPPPGQAGAWELLAGVRDSAERARLRMAEDARALALAAREPLNLPLLDQQYRRRARSQVGLIELDRALAEAGVAAASRVYAPAGIGGHADHLLARRYARLLLAAGVPVTLYADVPYCFFHGWPSWVDGEPPSAHRNVDAYWLSFLSDVPEMPALHAGEVHRLDAASMRAKREAVQSYETSLNHGVRHLLGEEKFGGFEVRWPLVAGAGREKRSERGPGAVQALESIGDT